MPFKTTFGQSSEIGTTAHRNSGDFERWLNLQLRFVMRKLIGIHYPKTVYVDIAAADIMFDELQML